MTTFLLTVLFLLVAIVLLAIRIVLVPDGTFRRRCAHSEGLCRCQGEKGEGDPHATDGCCAENTEEPED